MMREQVSRGEAVRLLKALLEQINALTADGSDTSALCARYRAAGDAIVDGQYGQAKLILTSRDRPPSPPTPSAGALIKIDFVRGQAIRVGRS
jgi:hypothetical protein